MHENVQQPLSDKSAMLWPFPLGATPVTRTASVRVPSGPGTGRVGGSVRAVPAVERQGGRRVKPGFKGRGVPGDDAVNQQRAENKL